MKQNVYDYSFQMRRKRAKKITFITVLILSVILFLILFLDFILFPVHVNSVSMETDVVKGSAVFVTPIIKTPQRGDIMYVSRLDKLPLSPPQRILNTLVMFFTAQKYYPFGYTDNMTGKPMLRRVLGLPGDTVFMKDYVLYIIPKGETKSYTEFELWSKPYNIHIYSIPAEWNGMGSCGDMEPVVLSKDEYFVLADNRIEGTDSRVWGVVNANRIRGKAILEYFPLNKTRIL